MANAIVQNKYLTIMEIKETMIVKNNKTINRMKIIQIVHYIDKIINNRIIVIKIVIKMMIIQILIQIK
jgi:hypothetical protein